MLKEILQEVRSFSGSGDFAEAEKYCLDWAGDSEFLSAWINLIGRNSIEIKWSAECVVLYGGGEIIERQVGYESKEWQKNWVVVGDVFSDPIILDMSSGVFFLAKHGVGVWSPVKITNDIETFFSFMYIWCEIYYVVFKENILDEDYEVSDKFLNCLSTKVLAELGGKANWEGVLIAVKG